MKRRGSADSCDCISRRGEYSRLLRHAVSGAKEPFVMLQVHQRQAVAPAAERLEYARQIVRGEASALELVAQRLGDSFVEAIDLLFQCPGRVAITGTGKSADVGQKIAGTLNSTGTRAYL